MIKKMLIKFLRKIRIKMTNKKAVSRELNKASILKRFKGTTNRMETGDKTGMYKVIPSNKHEKKLLKNHGCDKPFECYSIGNDKAQIALIPTDYVGKETAKANADLFAVAFDMLDVLLDIENDDNRIPKAIWDKRNEVINRALKQ